MDAELLPEAGLDRNPLATLGATAGNYRASALGLHTRPKTVRLRTVTAVRLECALRHEKYLLLIRSIALKRTKSINDNADRGKPARNHDCFSTAL